MISRLGEPCGARKPEETGRPGEHVVPNAPVLAGRADQPGDFLGLQSAARDGGGLARIRERLRAGDYDSPAIIDEVARRIVISGDL